MELNDQVKITLTAHGSSVLNEDNKKNMNRRTYKIDIDFDICFWALFPAININLHSREFEFEWLCLGVYIGKQRYDIREVE